MRADGSSSTVSHGTCMLASVPSQARLCQELVRILGSSYALCHWRSFSATGARSCPPCGRSRQEDSACFDATARLDLSMADSWARALPGCRKTSSAGCLKHLILGLKALSLALVLFAAFAQAAQVLTPSLDVGRWPLIAITSAPVGLSCCRIIGNCWYACLRIDVLPATSKELCRLSFLTIGDENPSC